MHSIRLVSAVVALGAGLALADDCSKKQIKLSASSLTIDCDNIFQGDIIVGSDVSGQLSLEGPKQVKGDIIIHQAKLIESISSSSINAIGGTFELSNLEALNSVTMTSLESVNNLTAVALPNLNSFSLGKTGVTKASIIVIQDTFLSDLSGLNTAQVDSFTISTNSRLTTFNSDLKTVTDTLIIYQNGNEMTINMTKLKSVGEVQLVGIKTFSVPGLTNVTKNGLKFNSNPELISFKAPNLTNFNGSITFSNNPKLQNVSFPVLTEINQGDITLQQNKNLTDFTGFPELEKIDGSLRLKGSFETVSLPKLDFVKGAVEATTTSQNSSFCEFFNKKHEDGAIKVTPNCTYDNKNANGANTSGGKTTDGSGGSGNSTSSDKNSAVAYGANMAMLGAAVLGGLLL